MDEGDGSPSMIKDTEQTLPFNSIKLMQAHTVKNGTEKNPNANGDR